MGFNVGLKDILIAGGPTLAALLALSVYTIAVIWERWRFFERSTSGQRGFLEKVRGCLQESDLTAAAGACRSYRGLASSVVLATLSGPTSRDDRKRSAQRAVERAMALLEGRLAQLGTIASISPFIGLFGTVVGIMHAFKDLARSAGAGPGVVAVGISEALVCTAAGLLVAIPAVVAYNYFTHRAARFAEEMSWISDEVLEGLAQKARP